MSDLNFIENFLNLLWLLIALASFVWWWARWSTPEPEKRGNRSRVSFLALSCVLFLLFPVISLSDDLQEIAAVVEYSGSSPRVFQDSKGALPGSYPAKKSAAFVFVDLAPLLSPPAALWHQAIPADPLSRHLAPRRPVQGRAPPR